VAASRHGNTPNKGIPVTRGSGTPYTTSVDANVGGQVPDVLEPQPQGGGEGGEPAARKRILCRGEAGSTSRGVYAFGDVFRRA